VSSELLSLQHLLVAALFATAALATSCADDASGGPDGVEFATLDKLIEVTGCVRSEDDTGYTNASDSGWSWDSGSSWDSGYASDTGASGDTSSGSEAIDTAERSGTQSSAPPKSRPCMPAERVDEVQTASCSDSSAVKGSFIVLVWSLPFVFGRRRSS